MSRRRGMSHEDPQVLLRRWRSGLLGYTCVSTRTQDDDALLAHGAQRRDILTDTTSGARATATRPGMTRLLEYAVEGDTVVVWRVDRLGRSLIDVLNTVTLLQSKGVGVLSISDGIDPAPPPPANSCSA